MPIEKVLLASFVAVESAHAFSAFCPSLFTIKTFATDEDKKNAVRIGYLPSVIFALVLGVVVSKLIGSWMPVVFSGATVAFMIGAYEVAMR